MPAAEGEEHLESEKRRRGSLRHARGQLLEEEREEVMGNTLAEFRLGEGDGLSV